jgi:putative glutamine amidotransferase
VASPKPIIGITSDFDGEKHSIAGPYASSVARAGGVPVLLPCIAAEAAAFAELCGGIVFSGGDDPIMEHFGIPTHAKAKPVHPDRQAFELALLEALDCAPQKPVLGICLGMQMMGLHHGGRLDQHLPDSLTTASMHWGRVKHNIRGEVGHGEVLSNHRQALVDPGSMRVVAEAFDGVIEAVQLDDRPFYLGVQWHAERTADQRLGAGVFQQLIDAARRVPAMHR